MSGCSDPVKAAHIRLAVLPADVLPVSESVTLDLISEPRFVPTIATLRVAALQTAVTTITLQRWGAVAGQRNHVYCRWRRQQVGHIAGESVGRLERQP